MTLAVRRGERIIPMSLGFEPKAGGVAAVALYEREQAEPLRALRELGWTEQA